MLTKAQEEFAKNFKINFTLLSYLSSGTLLVGVCLLVSGATQPMTRAQKLFESLTEWHSKLHVEFGFYIKHVVKGVGMFIFQLQPGSRLEVKEALWVPELRWSMFAISIIENGFCVSFQDGQTLIRPMGSNSNKGHVTGVSESNLYK